MSDDRLKVLAERLGIADKDLDELGSLLIRRRARKRANVTTIVYSDFEETGLDGFRGLMEPTGDGGKYEDIEEIGRGGTSEIRRVHDPELKRDMAMKILLGYGGVPGSNSPDSLARFLEEAQVTAQLQHPAIVPIFELGVLPDDRTYFTMEEVRGRTFGEVVADVHTASQDVWAKTDDGWTLRKLIEVFRRVCEAVAYAHSRGVVHRDIKPENIMVGEFGDVKLMDWGLAKVLDATKQDIPFTVKTVRSAHGDSDALITHTGVIAGTPSFMAPEQADHTIGPITRQTDVYSLGAVLYYILANRTHYHGLNTMQVLYRVVNGAPDELIGRPNGPMLPKPLIAIWERATQRDPELRYPDANAIGKAISHWLDGAERREAAMRSVQLAALERRQTRNLRKQARKARKEGQATLAAVPNWASEAEKAPGWASLDEASRLDLEARRHELTMEEHLSAAFAHDPQLPEAHLTMIRLHARRHKAAEQRGEIRAARDHLWVVKRHLAALSAEWPGKAQFTRYVEGVGRLQLTVEPKGATIRLNKFETKNRRLVAQFVQELSDVEDVEIPMGSYLLEISAEGHDTARYPVLIPRTGTWKGVVELPVAGTVGDDEILVAGGPYKAGVEGAEARCDTFIMLRDPVTQGDWTEFVNATESMNPDLPITGITWDEAAQFARWRSAQTGVPWRLPTVQEWEKAARGCDGRRLPWGDQSDPAWTHSRDSAAGPIPSPVGEHEFDVSPYGVRGMGGNVSEWTGSPIGPDDPNARIVCGGSCFDDADEMNSAFRTTARINERSGVIGFRLVRFP